MPNYDYVCGECGERYELNHPMSAKGKYRCSAERCDGTLVKMLSSFGIGNGFNGRENIRENDSYLTVKVKGCGNCGAIDIDVGDMSGNEIKQLQSEGFEIKPMWRDNSAN